MMSLRLILVSIIWGVNFSFVKYALGDFHPLSFTVVRFSLSALLLLCIMMLGREPFGIESRDRAPFLRLGLIGITLYNIFFMYGLEYTTASNSALFISTSPLFAALIQTLSKREPLCVRSGLGFLLSSLGVFLIIKSKPGGIGFTRHDLAGDLLTLCAAVFWALYTLNAKPLLEKYSALKVTAYSMAAGALMLIPLGLKELMSQTWRTVSPGSWFGLGFAAFISGSAGFTLWYQGVKRLGVTRTIVYHYLVPLVAVIFAALFLQEQMTFPQILGAAAVLTGVYLVQKRGQAAF